MALGTQMGFPGVSDWIDPRRRTILGFAAGLAGGQTPQQGIAMGLQGAAQGREADDAWATTQKAEQERQAQLNQTAEWIKNNYPQFSSLPVEQGFTLASQQRALDARTAAAGNGGPDAPSSVREWEYFNALSPEDQGAFLRMKRANPYLDLGDRFGQPDPVNPGTISGPVIPKNGTVPTGFEQTGEGGIAPMPGSPDAMERQAAADEAAASTASAEVRTQMLNERTDLVTSKIDEAIGQVSWDSTGLVGQVMGNVAGTKAFNLRRTVDTVIANIGFSELQAMREASPTGGALGQVAVQELNMLQSVLSSLSADQSDAQLLTNLAEVKRLLERQKQYRQMANEAKFGGAGAAPSGGTDDVDAILRELGI